MDEIIIWNQPDTNYKHKGDGQTQNGQAYCFARLKSVNICEVLTLALLKNFPALQA